MSSPPFEALGGGRFRVALPSAERQLLAGLAKVLRSMLTESPDNDGLRRLFPTAYPDDPEREAEYRSLMGDDLLARRLATADTLESTAEATELDQADLMAWIAAINDLRLLFGTRLDVSESDDVEERIGQSGYAVYHLLSWLLEHLMECAFTTVGPGDDSRAPE